MRIPELGIDKIRQGMLSRKGWLLMLAGAAITLAVIGAITLIKHSQVPIPYQKQGITIPWLPDTVRRWSGLINEMSKKYNVDANAMAIVMTIESGGYSQAGSSADAQGLMQVTPPTARDIATKYLKKPVESYDLMDPRTSVEFGSAYLAYLRKTFGSYKQGPSWNETVELIAAGYNGGPGAANSLEQGKGLNDTQTVVYSRDAFNMWRERNASSSPTFNRWLERGGSRLIDLAKAEKN